jgi:hypothetical protein
MPSAFTPPFVFRAAADEVELERLFRLRHHVFSASAELYEVLAGVRLGLDVVSHDHYAVHYGVFDNEGRALASIRAIDRHATRHTPLVRRIVRRCGLEVPEAVAVPFPMLAQVDRARLGPVLQTQIARGLHVVECGRVCVDPAAAGARARIFHFLAECTLAAEFFARRIDAMYGLSPPSLFRYYRQFGFARVPEVPDIEAFSTRVRGVLFSLERDKLERGPLARSLPERAQELLARGHIPAPFDQALYTA